MASSDLITFSTPKDTLSQVSVLSSATMELAYAYFLINRPDSQQKAADLPWLQDLYAEHLELINEIKSFWSAEGECSYLFNMVGELGYHQDPDPKRFFAEFDKLPQRTIEFLNKNVKAIKNPAHVEKERKMLEDYLRRLEALKDTKLRKAFLGQLKRLWAILEPLWKREGRAESEQACGVFLHKYAQSGTVLGALPTHHFVQFEDSVQAIQASLDKERLVVIPLYFAAGGGFNIDLVSHHFIGYGIQSEHHFEKMAQRTAAAANRIKAVADPTRLLLLSLIARYKGFGMTVSDFARQLDVSQPTVSGHLKLLKEAELVTVEKKGNKSIYSVNKPVVEESIAEFKKLVLEQ